jgi:hypothetical protein
MCFLFRLIRFGSAFIGNRCSRYYARHGSDWIAQNVAFPLSAAFIAPYLDQNSRPVIVMMGFLRAILPFAASFQGSRLGRQLVRTNATARAIGKQFISAETYTHILSRFVFRHLVPTDLPITGGVRFRAS